MKRKLVSKLKMKRKKREYLFLDLREMGRLMDSAVAVASVVGVVVLLRWRNVWAIGGEIMGGDDLG